ncbi:MAG: alpha/beta hydrolase [Candidatus Dormibacteraeota bacterium]|nr:alpha/beta hydrolase [Candidatus Dormibacteraeota bacterium]
MAWAHIEGGEGRPLVLVHGIGSSKRSWLPIIDRLVRTRRVVAVDLPGFGDSPPLTDGLPTAMHFAELLPSAVAELGVAAPFDIAGFSLGGWIALEVAKRGSAQSVVALTPAGLWARQPRWSHFLLDSAHRLARARLTPLVRALGSGVGRTALMSSYYGRPWRMSADFAMESSELMAACVDFDRTLEGLRQNRFTGGQGITVPVTVAFGTRDMIHPPGVTRRRDQLPASHTWINLPGCGHVPMSDDPELVASVIIAGTE